MHGLHVYRASRIEALARLLAEQLADQVHGNALEPQRVVVAHLGLKRWLFSELSRRRNADGSPGIAANLEMLLPGEWWDRLADGVIGPSDSSVWQHAVLRWRLFALLDDATGEAELQRYLDHAPPRRRWHLAERVARLFGQYQIYREDWLLEWAQGHAAPASAWQARLWRRLLKDGGDAPRIERAQQLQLALQRGADLTGMAPVHVFGVSHLPPVLLRGLQLVARSRPVHLYFPDPCRELWDYLRSKRSLLRLGPMPDAQYLEVGHPLLASLGRVGQEFAASLNVHDETQHWRDEADEAESDVAGMPLLARVQEGIRRMQPGLAALSSDADPRRDDSLRVHACHSRLRELEALRDALLAMRDARPDLEPREIVVMAPDIQTYAPLLPAVFGVPGRWHDAGLPYHLADVALSATHPVYAVWRQLLGLSQSRCTRAEILGLLDAPALARRFGLHGSRRARVAGWLREAHVAWALDASMKTSFGAPAEDLHSLAFGIDRLIAGWLMGKTDLHQVLEPAVATEPVVVPMSDVTGSDFDLLAGLSMLLGWLVDWRNASRAVRSGGEWSAWLSRRIETCFDPDPEDQDSRDALVQIQRIAARLGSEAAAAKLRCELPWAVVAEHQHAALDEVPAVQPYVAGGVTFCGMVPQRTVPFRVVAILGLGEGVYPRAATRGSLDLIARYPRHGDRSSLEEDRYLFLEAIMSAREALHLSYICEGADDGAMRNPAAPLSELLKYLDEAFGWMDSASAPWFVRHALQPFAPIYFEQPSPAAVWRPDPALRSYAHAYAGVVATGQAPAGARPILPSVTKAPPSVLDTGGPVNLTELRLFLRNPARVQARELLGVRLPELDEEGDDGEPLAARVDARLRLPRQILQQALVRGQRVLPEDVPAWLARSGLLPAGEAAQQVWRALRSSVQAALGLLDGHPCLQATNVEVECRFEDDCGNFVSGEVPALCDAEGGYWLLRIETRKTLDFGVRLPLWLDAAALALSVGEQFRGCLLVQLHEDGARFEREAESITRDSQVLREGVGRLRRLQAAVLAGHALYFPATAWALANADPGQRRARAMTAWSGDGRRPGERDRSPGYAALLTRGLNWLEDPESWTRFETLALDLRTMLSASTEAVP